MHLITPAGVFDWYDGLGGTRMTLNSTGLGVGVAPSSAKLEVDGSGRFSGFGVNSIGLNTTGTAQSFVRYTTAGADCYIGTESSVAGGFFTGSTAYATCIYNASNTPIQFFTNGSVKTTLDASGNLLVGTTSSQGRLTVNDTSLSAGTCRIYKNVASSESLPALTLDKKDNTSTTSQVFLQFTINSQTAGSGQINANGASQAAFGSYSDSRLKENIVSLPSQLANILSLRPVEFDYKDGSGHQIGFVAQEIQEVYSDTVGEQNGFLTVTGWSKTEARLVSAIKELAAKVQALEAKLA
jgi:hypothetical protein